VNDLLGSTGNYGSPRVLGNLSIVLQGINQYTSYNRSLDLTTGVHTTTFLGNDRNTYTTVVYCSYPAKTCIYRLSSTAQLPNVAVSLENKLVNPSSYEASCGPSSVQLSGNTRGKGSGMEYDIVARISTGPLGMPMSSCSTNNKGTIVITGSAYGKELILNSFSVVVSAGTDYDASKGNVASRFSFKGISPRDSVAKLTASAAVKIESKLFAAHIQDYQRLMGGFQLELNDPWKGSQYPSESLDFYSLMDRYKYSAKAGSGRKMKRAAFNGKTGQSDNHLAKMAQPILKRQTQFAPTRVAMQDKWESVTTAAPFPEFDFPKTLAKGVTLSGPVPWSTDGVITVTGQNGAKQTVTLTSAPAVRVTAEAIPLAVPDENTESFSNPEPVRTSPQLVFEVEDTTDGSRAVQDIQDTQQSSAGDPYVEGLLFDYARHLFISSSRDDSLPPTLQGRWTDRLENLDGAYRSNINMQMNHWFADQVGLGDLQDSLFKFMKNTWMPRGKETARIVYGAPGWVAHEDMNIFGHTGIKSKANCKMTLTSNERNMY
jgi:hypothetical protein